MSEKWETVGRTAKKSSAKQNGSKHQSDKKAFNETAPRIEPNAPLVPEKSLYDALQHKQSKPDSNGTKVKHSGIPRPANKKSVLPPKPKLNNVVEAMTGEEFLDVFKKAQGLFKNAPLAWLKEITGHMNARLDDVPQNDPTYGNEQPGFPAKMLSPEIVNVFHKACDACSAENLQSFIDTLVQHIITDMTKGLSVYGYQMVAQILSNYKPDLFTQNLAKYVELIINNKNSPPKCLAVLWIFSQCGYKNFSCGLKVWLNLMLPILGIKSLSNYGVSYLGKILQKAGKSVDKGYDIVELKHFFLVLDGIYANNSTIQPQLQKRLKEYYPVLKKLSFGRNPAQTVQKFFPSFLMRLIKACSKELSKEILDCIINCLSSDSQCFSAWRQMYTKHMVQSSIVLNYIADNWSTKCSGIKANILLDTVRAFTITNEETTKAVNGLEDCKLACKKIESMLSLEIVSPASKPKIFAMLVLFSVGVLIGIDLYSHSGYHGSKTEFLLQESGVQKAAMAASVYLSQNVPGLVEKIVIYVEPMATAVWELALQLIQILIEVTQPARNWLIENVPLYIDWIMTHPIWNHLYGYIMQLWEIIQPYINQAVDVCSNVLTQARQFINHLVSQSAA